MNAKWSVLRRKALFLLGIVLCAGWLAIEASRCMAAEKVAEKGDKKPAAAAADKAEADTADKATEGEKDVAKKEAPKEENFLVWVIRCSGLIGGVIVILSIYFISTVGRLFWEMRIEVAAPPAMVLQCEGLLEQRDFKGIFNLVKDDDSFFSRLLATGIADLPNGLAEAREAMERTSEAVTAEMEKKISMLAVLGTLGPMIGLLGTLKGMIAAFGTIARVSGSGIDPSMVANNLSEALLLTFEGVALSVPAIYFYAVFRNRVIHISTSVSLTCDQFLRHFSHAGRMKTAPVAKAPGQPPAVPPVS
jgi:biopolymer transport protein ExbB